MFPRAISAAIQFVVHDMDVIVGRGVASAFGCHAFARNRRQGKLSGVSQSKSSAEVLRTLSQR